MKPTSELTALKKITVIYNKVSSLTTGTPSDILADEDTIRTAKAIYNNLFQSGLHVELFELREDNWTDLLTMNTDFIFNLCYGVGSIPKTEDKIPMIIDVTGIPYTGASSREIQLTTDKVATKRIFLKKHIPTPLYQLFRRPDSKLKNSLKYPLIVKPQMEDSSLGIHNDAVVENETELRKKVSEILDKYNEPALVEQFINTRELNVTILGNGKNLRVLPISEIIFGDSFDSEKKWKIVDFEAKWQEETSNFRDTVGVCPARLDRNIEKQIIDYAVAAYRGCNCRDYARIDIRLDEDNTPYFLEVNLNPGIGPEDGAVRSAKAAGMSYASFLTELIEISLDRFN